LQGEDIERFSFFDYGYKVEVPNVTSEYLPLKGGGRPSAGAWRFVARHRAAGWGSTRGKAVIVDYDDKLSQRFQEHSISGGLKVRF
jgi:hypothetical protein